MRLGVASTPAMLSFVPAVMTSLIAVPVAILALASVVEAQDDTAAQTTFVRADLEQVPSQLANPSPMQRRQLSSKGEAAVAWPTVMPRQVLLIDLNPVLDFGALADQSQEKTDRLSVEASESGVEPSSEPHPWMSSASGAARWAESQRPAKPQRQAELQAELQTWDAPFPSLGKPQLDRQLRHYLAYLETVGQPDIVIVGGQGAVQGVDPLALRESLGDRGYSDLKIFNWGLSDSSAQTVEWLLTDLLRPEQLPKLVVWADTSVALNSDRLDSAFRRIEASPGNRFLARGLRPKLAEQEKQLALKLKAVLRRPVSRPLPGEVVALARSPRHGSSSAGEKHRLTLATAKQTRKGSAMGFAGSGSAAQIAASQVPTGQVPTSQASTARGTPLLMNARSQVLPILLPQQPLPVSPPTTPPTNSSANVLAHAATQSSNAGFRLVNWCRAAHGPCQTETEPAGADPAQPAWMRQTQAGQSAARQAAASLAESQRPQRHSAVLAANPHQPQPALNLPSWPQNRAVQPLLRAMGFQSVEQQLSAQKADQLRPLRGDQDQNYRNFSLQGQQNRALHRLVQFGQQQGMAIAFVQLPLSQQYLDLERQSREQSFRTYLNVAAQMTPLNLVDLPGDELWWNDALFAKPNRLNRYGAAALGWQIGQAMEGTVLKAVQ